MAATTNQTTQPKQKEPFNLVKWAKSRKGQRSITFTYLPFGEMFRFSFYRMKYIGPKKFVGLDNYIQVFKRDDCFGALKLSLYYIGGALLQLVIA